MSKPAQDVMLAPEQVEQVLQRLGFGAPPATDPGGLRDLYEAWCRKVPFDNARKLIAIRSGATSPLPGDEPAEFFQAWLSDGAGATCWAGNGALCALLRALGFAAQRVVATMMVAPNLPPNHGSVVVALPDGPHIVDASILHVEPLVMRPGHEVRVAHGAWGVRGHWLDDRFAIRWRGLHVEEPFDCRIDEWPVDAVRFREQHEATRTWSPFNFELTLNLVRDEGRIGIAQGRAVTLDANGVMRSTALSDRLAYLVDVVGFSERLAAQIPSDLPTPPPPGSRTAAGRA